MDIKQLPHTPGDIVRDRKSGEDYVIESILVAAGAGKLTLTAINLMNDRLEKWHVRNSAELNDTHIILKKNTLNLTAAEVKSEWDDIIKIAAQKNKNILDQLVLKENVALRDLFLAAYSSEDNWVPQSIIALAESLVTLGKNVPSRRAIVSALKEATDGKPGQYSDEALEMFANEIEEYAKSSIKPGQFLNQKSTVLPLLINAKGELKGDAITLSKAFKFRYSQKNDGYGFGYLRDVLTGAQQGHTELYADFLPGRKAPGGESRIASVAKKIFMDTTGEYSQAAEAFVNENAKAVYDTLVHKKNGTKSSNMLLDMIANHLLKADTKFAQLARASEVAGLGLYTPEQMARRKIHRLRQTGELNITNEQAELMLKKYSSYYRNKNAIRKPGSRSLSSYRGNSLAKLSAEVSLLSKKSDRVYAVSMDALFNSALGRARIKIGQEEGKLTDRAIMTALKQGQSSMNPYMVISSSKLRKLLGEMKDAQLDSTIDLTDIIADHNAYEAMLHPLDSAEIASIFRDGVEGEHASWDHSTGYIPLYTDTKLPSKNTKGFYVYSHDEKAYAAKTLEELKNRFGGESEVNGNLFFVPSRVDDDDPAFYRQREFYKKLQKAKSVLEFETGPELKVVNEAYKHAISINLKEGNTIDKVIGLLSSKNRADKGLILRRAKPSRAAAEQTITEIDKSTRFALGQLKTGDGSGPPKFRLIGSEIDVDVKMQMDRVKAFYDGKAQLLDIESYKDAKGYNRLRQVALGSRGNYFTILDDEFTSIEKQAESMIKLAGEVENRIKQKQFIGTMGHTDFDVIIDHTQLLIDDQLDAATKTRLKKALNIFYRARDNNLFDIGIAYSLAGHDLGRANQGLLTYLTSQGKKTQLHEALQDIKDAEEILNKIRPNIESSSFNTNVKPKYWMSTSLRSPETLAGVPLEIIGLQSRRDADTGQKWVFLQTRALAVEDGKLVKTNIIRETRFSSVQLAGAALNIDGEFFDEEEFFAKKPVVINGKDTEESLFDTHKRLMQDHSGRQMRALNPISRSKIDPTGSLSMDGTVSAFNLTLDAQVYSQMDLIQSTASRTAERLIKDNNDTTQLVRYMDHTSRMADDIIKRLDRNGQFRDWYGLSFDELSDNVRESFHGKIEDVLRDARVAQSYLDDSLEYTQLLKSDSPAAALLKDAAAGVVGRTSESGFFASGDEAANFNYHLVKNYLDFAAAKGVAGLDEAETANRINASQKELLPRLKLAIGDKISNNVKLGNQAQVLQSDLLVAKMATDLLLDVDKAPENIVNKIHQLAGGKERFETLMDEFKTAHSAENNLEGWKVAMAELQYRGQQDQWAELKRIHTRLANSTEMQEAIFSSLQTNIDKFQELQANDMVSFGNELVASIRERTSTDKPQVGKALRDSLLDAWNKDDGKSLTRFMLQEQPLYGSITQDISEDLLSQITQGYTENGKEFHGINKVLSYLGENLDPDFTLTDVIVEANDAYRKALEEGVRGTELQQVWTNKMENIITLHQQGTKWSELLTVSRFNNITEQARSVNKATAAAAAENAKGVSEKKLLQEMVAAMGGEIMAPSQVFKRLSVPLMALGGIAGLLGAVSPNTGDAFSQGQYSKNNASRMPSSEEFAISKFSGLPGNPDNIQMWSGSVAPFQLDISFRGFVGDKAQQERLQREVYNIISNNMEVRSTQGEVQDHRNRNHRVAAVDALRGQI